MSENKFYKFIPKRVDPKDLKSKKFFEDVDFLSFVENSKNFPNGGESLQTFCTEHEINLQIAKWWVSLSPEEKSITLTKSPDAWYLNEKKEVLLLK